jgi:hypothetical protein
MTSRELRNCVVELDGISDTEGNEFCLRSAEVEFYAEEEKDRLPKTCRAGMR